MTLALSDPWHPSIAQLTPVLPSWCATAPECLVQAGGNRKANSHEWEGLERVTSPMMTVTAHAGPHLPLQEKATLGSLKSGEKTSLVWRRTGQRGPRAFTVRTLNV